MKPLAATDSNGVPSQQDKTPVSSAIDVHPFLPLAPLLFFFPPLALIYDPVDMITGRVMDVHRISIEPAEDEWTQGGGRARQEPGRGWSEAAYRPVQPPMCVSVLY